jgi:hypothetical protein
VDDERRDAYARDERERACARVIIVGVAKAAVRRGVAFVKFAKRADAPQAARVVAFGIEARGVSHASLETADELALINPIGASLDGVCGRGQLDGRRDNCDAF